MLTRIISFIIPAAIFILQGCHDSEHVAVQPDYENWSLYLGDKHSTQYSTLIQITKDNVHQLEVAWEYKTGDSEGRQILLGRHGFG